MKIDLSISKDDDTIISVVVTVSERANSENTQILGLHLLHHQEVMSEGVWATTFLLPASTDVSQIFKIEDREPGRYSLSISSLQNNEFSMAPNVAQVLLEQYFLFEDKLVILDQSAQIEISAQQQAANLSVTQTQRVTEGEAGQKFEVVSFFEGVVIGHPVGMRGASVFPLEDGIRDEGTMAAVAPYLKQRHSIDVGDRQSWGPFLNFSPGFAVDVHNLEAIDFDDASQFGWTFASDVALAIGSEQADKARPFMQLILNHSGDWRLTSVRSNNSWNLLPPMFLYSTIKRVVPVIRADSFLKLVYELMVDALGERDRGLRFFRMWGVLEVLADREIVRKKQALQDPRGTTITLDSGTPLTTERKEGRVYELLRSSGLPPIIIGQIPAGNLVIEGAKDESWQNAKRLITLWDAVAAHYSIRNEVAHEGRFDINKTRPTDRQLLAIEFFTKLDSFIRHALTFAAQKQFAAALARISSLNRK